MSSLDSESWRSLTWFIVVVNGETRANWRGVRLPRGCIKLSHEGANIMKI